MPVRSSRGFELRGDTIYILFFVGRNEATENILNWYIVSVILAVPAL